jgi:hypothetical protein
MVETGWWASFCGGCVYAFSGYWCMHAGDITQVMAGGWAPWVCWAAVRWLRHNTRARFGLLAVIAGIQVLPGGTENVTYLFWTLSFLAVVHILVCAFRLARPARGEPARSGLIASITPGLGIILALALGAALSGVQVIPSLENLLFSFRWGGMGYEYAGRQSIPLWKPLVEIIIPNYGGHYGSTPCVAAEIPHPETVSYVGPIAVFLAALAVIRGWHNQAVRMCFGLTLVALLLAFGRFTPLHRGLYSLGFSVFRSPARAVYLVTLGEAVLCAWGAQSLLESEGLQLSRRIHKWVILGLAVVAVAIFWAVAQPEAFGWFQRHTLPWLYAGDISVTLLAAAMGHLSFTRLSASRKRALVFLALVIPLFVFLRESEFWNLPMEDAANARNKARVAAEARSLLGNYRVYSRHWSLFISNEVAGNGLRDVGGMHGGLCPLRRFWELQLRVTPDSHLAVTRGRRFLDILGGRYLLSRYPMGDPDYRLLCDAEPYRVYENPFARPRLSFVPRGAVLSDEATLARLANGDWDPSAEVLLDGGSPFHGRPGTATDGPTAPRFVIDGNDEVVCEVLAPTAGYLLLSDTYYPGWQAFVDGGPAEILRANYVFRAVALVPGKHLVEFRYRPQSLAAGFALSMIALLTLLLVMKWRGQRSRLAPD